MMKFVDQIDRLLRSGENALNFSTCTLVLNITVSNYSFGSDSNPNFKVSEEVILGTGLNTKLNMSWLAPDCLLVAALV